jgi:hypothetical protein
VNGQLVKFVASSHISSLVIVRASSDPFGRGTGSGCFSCGSLFSLNSGIRRSSLAHEYISKIENFVVRGRMLNNPFVFDTKVEKQRSNYLYVRQESLVGRRQHWLMCKKALDFSGTDSDIILEWPRQSRKEMTRAFFFRLGF